MKVKGDISKSEEVLSIIRELEANPQATQRYLSAKFSVSLGKINFLINALIDKGIIEARNFKNSKSKLAYMYLLTPKGIKTKLELTRKFFEWKLQEYHKLGRELAALKKEPSFIRRETGRQARL